MSFINSSKFIKLKGLQKLKTGLSKMLLVFLANILYVFVIAF